MESVYAKCTNQAKKACRNEIQYVPRAKVDGSTGKVLEVRCHFCRQRDTLRVVSWGEIEGNRDAKARLREGGRR